MPDYLTDSDFFFLWTTRPKLGWEKVGEVEGRIAHVIRNTHDPFS